MDKKIRNLIIDSIKKNYILIEHGYDNKDINEIFIGSHNIKGLGFINIDNIIKISTNINNYTKNKSYNELNQKKINYLIKQLKNEKDLLKYIK